MYLVSWEHILVEPTEASSAQCYLRPRDTAARVRHAEGGAGEADATHDVPLHEGVGQQGVRKPHLRDGIEMLVRL